MRRLPLALSLALAALPASRGTAAESSSPAPEAEALRESIGKPAGPVRDVPGVKVPPTLIFFPPVPPPLEAAEGSLPQSRTGTPTAPPELAHYVGETFYAPLSTWLARNELSEKLRQRLDRYRIARDDLRQDLSLELARQREADPATRRQALATLARQQAPRLAELEAMAEALRHDLVDGFYSWFAQREWHLGEPGLRGDRPEDVVTTLEAYGAYNRALLLPQRGLLREIAAEVGGEDLVATNDDAPLFFSPATARVRLPATLPPELAGRIAEYRTRKATLKKELYDAIQAQERASFLRGNTLKAIAAGQASALARLDELTEEIREGLARLPNIAPPPARPVLPPVSTDRVAVLVRQRTAPREKALEAIAAIERELREARVPAEPIYAFEAARLVFDMKPMRRSLEGFSREHQHKMETAVSALKAVAAAYERDLAANAQALLAIRAEIAREPDAAGRSPDALLAAAVRHANHQETAEASRDYRTAVLEPGLSPAQRRLLFAHAIVQLRLPLPPGELQPTSRTR